MYTIGLKRKSKNVIAVNATNTGGPAGMTATVLVDYSDNSTETFVTDASWKTLQSVPPVGFANPGLDDSSWIAASEEGKNGVGPWGPTSLPPALDITQSNLDLDKRDRLVWKCPNWTQGVQEDNHFAYWQVRRVRQGSPHCVGSFNDFSFD